MVGERGLFEDPRTDPMKGDGGKKISRKKSPFKKLWLFFFPTRWPSHFRHMTHILTSALSSSKWLWKTHTWKILIKLWVMLDHYNSCLWRTAVQHWTARGKWIHVSWRPCHVQTSRKNNLVVFACSPFLVAISHFFPRISSKSYKHLVFFMSL